ncbi:MAG: hypothetical protein RLZZ158_2242, partial [Cyanobacteriota bacterium]
MEAQKKAASIASTAQAQRTTGQRTKGSPASQPAPSRWAARARCCPTSAGGGRRPIMAPGIGGLLGQQGRLEVIGTDAGGVPALPVAAQ